MSGTVELTGRVEERVDLSIPGAISKNTDLGLRKICTLIKLHSRPVSLVYKMGAIIATSQACRQLIIARVKCFYGKEGKRE